MVIVGNKCVTCEKWYGEKHTETTVIDDEGFHVCENCIADLAGPGKHEGVHENERGLCLVLESIIGHDGQDHWLSDEWNGWVGVIGRYVYLEDSRGFVEVREYSDKESAAKYVDSLERDGFGASEDDAWINSEYRGYSVSFSGKHIDTYDSLRRARAAVSLEMRRSGYYPNVWLAGERGNVQMIEVW